MINERSIQLGLACGQQRLDSLIAIGTCLQHDLRWRLPAAENHHSGTVVEPAMILHVEFFAVDVTIGDCHDAGIALHTEMEFVLCHRYAAPLAIDSLDANMHQVGAVGFPSVVFGSDAELFQAKKSTDESIVHNSYTS